MGVFVHHAIIVTGQCDAVYAAHAEASRIFPAVSPIVATDCNGFDSFFVPPDGSKEGWPRSDECDLRRAQFKAWLRARDCLDWVEVVYGPNYDGDGGAAADDHAWVSSGGGEG